LGHVSLHTGAAHVRLASAVGTAAATLWLAGCGAGESCLDSLDALDDAPILSVGEALAADGKLVEVRGPVVVGRDGVKRLCTSLSNSSPPKCVQPSLVVEGMRDLAAFDRTESASSVAWVRGAGITGRIEGDTLRIQLTCRAQRVVDRFEGATGDRLTLDTFSGGDSQVLDFATLLEHVPPPLRRKYGLFRIGVRATEDAEAPFADEIGDAEPDARGIYWARGEREWIALSYYEDRNVALAWIAGPRQRVDDRWETSR
jgi:hypothetical protein